MEEKLQKKNEESGDTCNGVPMPTGGGDYICRDGQWQKVDVPNEDVSEEDV